VDLFLQTLISGIAVGGLYTLLALGFSLILGTLKVVDFAFGSYVTASAFIATSLVTHVFSGGTMALAIAGVLLSAICIGIASSLIWGLALRHLFNKSHLTQLVATMGVGVIVTGVLLTIFGDHVAQARIPAMQQIVNVGPVYLSVARIMGGAVGLVFLLALIVLLRTRLGLMIQAAAMDEKGAAVIGINVLKARLFTVGIGAALGAVAGGMLAFSLPISPIEGNRLLLIAFLAVAVGGLGSIGGTTLAAFAVATLEIFSQVYSPDIIKSALPYIIVSLFIAFVPNGIGNVRISFR